MNEKTNFSDQLTVVDIVDMLLRKWPIMIFCALLIGVFSFAYTKVFISEVFSSTATLYVQSTRTLEDNTISTATISASKQLVTTYAEILKANTFLGQVARDLGKDDTYVKTIQKMITIAPVNDTEVMSITVKGTDPDEVYRITQGIVNYAPDELERVIGAGAVKILDNASEVKDPISPNVRTNTLVGVLAGMLIGGVIIVLLELFDTRIKNSEEITARYEEPLLGEIPSLLTENDLQAYGRNRRHRYGYSYGYGYGYSERRKTSSDGKAMGKEEKK